MWVEEETKDERKWTVRQGSWWRIKEKGGEEKNRGDGDRTDSGGNGTDY